ncbi:MULTISPECIES: multidrug efflux SMR transporter [unclassified Streptomyces]|uniref:DMT family transporter n=1 Tax=unclassified Streptomyces TaxID=2593676 RepID=UPI00278C0455|nr:MULTISPECIES: multidrug efflux SMR transporter [unclassified Streptomyces]
MAWAVLLLSGVFEAVWATALGHSKNFSETGPTIVFFIGLVISMSGLAYAMKKIPISVAYAVWIGIGAALTVTYAMVTGDEQAKPLKIVFLAGIILCVVGLKFVKTVPGKNAAPAPEPQADETDAVSHAADPESARQRR